MVMGSDIGTLRSTGTIRERCHKLYELGLEGKLHHFRIHRDKIAGVAKFVIDVTKENYQTAKFRIIVGGATFKLAALIALVGFERMPAKSIAMNYRWRGCSTVLLCRVFFWMLAQE